MVALPASAPTAPAAVGGTRTCPAALPGPAAVEVFEDLYRRCRPRLVELCRRTLSGGGGDAEALAQEAFVRAWASLGRLGATRPFWPWLSAVARRLCIDHRRRARREAAVLHVQADADRRHLPGPEELVLALEECRSARAALAALGEDERRMLVARDLEGRSYAEIATAHGVSTESVRASLRRARAALRRSYALVAGESRA